MTERQIQIARAALIYFQANLSDACEAFAPDIEDDPNNEADQIEVNGEPIDKPDEREIEELMFVLQ